MIVLEMSFQDQSSSFFNVSILYFLLNITMGTFNKIPSTSKSQGQVNTSFALILHAVY